MFATFIKSQSRMQNVTSNYKLDFNSRTAISYHPVNYSTISFDLMTKWRKDNINKQLQSQSRYYHKQGENGQNRGKIPRRLGCPRSGRMRWQRCSIQHISVQRLDSTKRKMSQGISVHAIFVKENQVGRRSPSKRTPNLQTEMGKGHL